MRKPFKTEISLLTELLIQRTSETYCDVKHSNEAESTLYYLSGYYAALHDLRDLIDNDEEFVKTLTTLITEYGDNIND